MIFVIGEIREGKLRRTSLPAITCAKKISEITNLPVELIAIGNYNDEIKKIRGVRKVYLVKMENYTAENYALNIKKIIEEKGGKYIVATATTFGKDLLPRLTAYLQDAAMVSEVISVESADTFKRLIWAGGIISTVKITSSIKVLSVRATAFEPTEDGLEPEFEEIKPTEIFEGKRFIKIEETKSERPELTEANVVVSVGRGIKGPENIQIVYKLLDIFNAALGASRAVVDAGWLPNDFQVGQTGKTVAPQLYIAIGISGAIQHIAGMKDSKVIVAINKDPDAPIFQIADYGLVADLFQAVPELSEKLEKIKKERSG